MSKTISFKTAPSPFAHASSPPNGEKQCRSRAKRRQRTIGGSLQTLFGEETEVQYASQGSSPSIPHTSLSAKRRRGHNRRRQSSSPSVFEVATQGPAPAPPMHHLKPPPLPAPTEVVCQKQQHFAQRNHNDEELHGSTTISRGKKLEFSSTSRKGCSNKLDTASRCGVQGGGSPGRNMHIAPLSPHIRGERNIRPANKITNPVRVNRLLPSKGVETATSTDQVETKSLAQRTVTTAGGTNVQIGKAQAESGEILVLQRKNTPRKARSSTAEKWTEAVVPAQFLHSEIQRCQVALQKEGKHVAPEVDRALDMWHANVARRLVEQNQLVLQNIDAVHQEKLVRRHVDSTRGDLICAKADVRRLKQELRQLKAKVEERKVWNTDRQIASRFLQALDRFRR